MPKIHGFKASTKGSVISEVQNFNDPELDLSHGELDNWEAKDIEQIFGTIPKIVTTINLDNNQLYNKYKGKLLTLFKAIPRTVCTLNLMNNPIPLHKNTFPQFSNILEQLPPELAILYLNIDISKLPLDLKDEESQAAFAKLPEKLTCLYLQINLKGEYHNDTADVLQKVLAALPNRKMALMVDLKNFPIRKNNSLNLDQRQKLNNLIATETVFKGIPSSVELTFISFAREASCDMLADSPMFFEDVTSISELLPQEQFNLLDNLPLTARGLSFSKQILPASSYQPLFQALAGKAIEELNLNALIFPDTDQGTGFIEMLEAMPRTVTTLYFKYNGLACLPLEQVKKIFARMSGVTTLHLHKNHFGNGKLSTEQLIEAFSALPPETKVYGLDTTTQSNITNEVIRLFNLYKNPDDKKQRAQLLAAARVACATYENSQHYPANLLPVAKWLEEANPQTISSFTSEYVASPTPIGQLFNGISRDSYKQFYTEWDSKEFCKNLLKDYVKQDTFCGLFFSGHWNRHHVKLVREILREFDTVYDNPVNFKKTIKTRIEGASHRLNPSGSLARRLDACIKIYQTNAALSQKCAAKTAKITN